MKSASIVALLLTFLLVDSTQARSAHGGGGRGRGYYGGGSHFGQGGYRHSGSYGYHGSRYYGSYGSGFGGYRFYGLANHYGPYYSSLYPYGIYHRPFPYPYSYYGGYPYSYGNVYRFNSYSVYSSPTPAGGPLVVKVYEFPEASSDLEDVDKTWAWGYLAEGNFYRASAIFAAMERQTPGAGWPKIGTGLLAGFNGDYGKALYQFRRAFRFDPSDPGRLPGGQELQIKLHQLSSHFKKEANNGRKTDADAEFMIAALSFLAGDNIGAQNAVEKALLHGDKSRSTRNLKDMVDTAVQAQNDEFLAARDQ